MRRRRTMTNATLPGFTADVSLYRTANLYRSTARGHLGADGTAQVLPQGCGLAKSIECGAFVTAGAATCTALCLAPGEGPLLCIACWSAFFPAGTWGFCQDCLPGWLQDLIGAVGGGEGGGGGGGGGPSPNPRCGCPAGTACQGGCVKEPGVGLICNGDCVSTRRLI